MIGRSSIPSRDQRGVPLSRLERLVLTLERGLDRWLSPLGVWVMRRTRGGITGPWHVEALVLTTRGRRSGRHRTVVLRFFPDGDSMVVVAANDGGRTDPGWFHNLRAEPRARVEVDGRAMAVQAQVLPDVEAAAWWERIVRIQPTYDRFRRATSRPFPVVRLTPVDGAGNAPEAASFP